MFYGKAGRQEDMKKAGIRYVLFKTDEKTVRGVILLLVNKDLTQANQIQWKTQEDRESVPGVCVP